MCKDCGCEQAGLMKQHFHHHTHGDSHSHSHNHSHNHDHHHFHDHSHDHTHGDDHDHTHDHDPSHNHAHEHVHTHPHLRESEARRLFLEKSVLEKNDRLAAENRRWFKENRIRVLNLISSPGSGKTTLLEKTIELLAKATSTSIQGTADKKKALSLSLAILTGDQEESFDANRLLNAKARAQIPVAIKQINTHHSCHLDSQKIAYELGSFVQPDHHRTLIIENVGNLVCPAAFDLGENQKVALLSTTEGEDKPSKYPVLFREADLVILTKADLIPHLDWKFDLCLKHIRAVNAKARVILLSAKSGLGMEKWVDFLCTPEEFN